MQPNLAPPTQDALAKVVGIILQARDRRLSKAADPPPDKRQGKAPMGVGAGVVELVDGDGSPEGTGGRHV